MKTSKKDFEEFKKSFLYWADRLFCPYRIDFFHTKLRDNYAEIFVDEYGKCATVKYNSELDKVDYEARPTPENGGKHEAIHLLLHRLVWLADQRFIGKDEPQEEWERLVRILEKVL
ncbi:MAG: hypothetical protein PHH26_00765 [Candidatus Thermoplasmatota archaeon]|nr:hypothetical protein [Candidatus Thermoplasmatota archaeon]